MVYSNYGINPKLTGFYANKQTYRLTDGKFILNVKKDEKVSSIDSEKSQSETVGQQNTDYNYSVITNISTSVNTHDPLTEIELTKSDDEFTQLINNLNSINESAAAYEKLPNADVELCESIRNEVNNLENKSHDLFKQKSQLLDTKVYVQAELKKLKFPVPPNPVDFSVTNTSEDGIETQVFDEKSFVEAMSVYEDNVHEHIELRNKYKKEMDNVIQKLKDVDMQFTSINRNMESLQKDFNSAAKIQDMINNDDNSKIVNVLKQQQEYLSSKISDNINKRNEVFEVESEIFSSEAPIPPIANDFYVTKTLQDDMKETVFDENSYEKAFANYETQMKEYNAKINKLNRKSVKAQKQISRNNIDIERELYNSDFFALRNELETKGTGSKAMYKIMAQSSMEYNNILKAKQSEYEVYYNTLVQAKFPEVPNKNNYQTEEDYVQAMNTYNYQNIIYNSYQQIAATRRNIATSRITQMDSDLEQIRRMLFGVKC